MTIQGKEYNNDSYRLDPEPYEDTQVVDTQVDELFDESQQLNEGSTDANVRQPRKVQALGEAKTAQMFAPGGLLDSQTTDSQWEVGLSFTLKQFAELCVRYEWKNGQFFTRSGEAVDVTHAFDPNSPYVTPATPEDPREAHVVTPVLRVTTSDKAVNIKSERDTLTGNPKNLEADPNVDGNKENVPPTQSSLLNEDVMRALIESVRHLMIYQERLASDFWEQANKAHETSALVKETLDLALRALHADQTQSREHDPEDGDHTVTYMGERAVQVRDGDRVWYLRADEPSQVILGSEVIPVIDHHTNHRGNDSDLTGKRGRSSDGKESGDEVSNSEAGSVVSEADDIPPLLDFDEEGPSLSRMRIHPMAIFGDLQEEIVHMSMKNQYSLSNAPGRCHVCCHRHHGSHHDIN